jgi:hypothetical protein
MTQSLKQQAEWLAPYLGLLSLSAPDLPATVRGVAEIIAGALVGEKSSLLAGPVTQALADRVEASLMAFSPSEIRYEGAKTRRYLPRELMFEFQCRLRDCGVVFDMEEAA